MTRETRCGITYLRSPLWPFPLAQQLYSIPRRSRLLRSLNPKKCIVIEIRRCRPRGRASIADVPAADRQLA
jgi:hypothetical protein